jgi:hypothetical protein
VTRCGTRVKPDRYVNGCRRASVHQVHVASWPAFGSSLGEVRDCPRHPQPRRVFSIFVTLLNVEDSLRRAQLLRRN